MPLSHLLKGATNRLEKIPHVIVRCAIPEGAHAKGKPATEPRGRNQKASAFNHVSVDPFVEGIELSLVD